MYFTLNELDNEFDGLGRRLRRPRIRRPKIRRVTKAIKRVVNKVTARPSAAAKKLVGKQVKFAAKISPKPMRKSLEKPQVQKAIETLVSPMIAPPGEALTDPKEFIREQKEALITLKKEEREAAKPIVAKVMKVLPIVTVVLSFIPVVQFVVPYLRLAMAAYNAAMARQAYVDAKKAKRQWEELLADLERTFIEKGVDAADAKELANRIAKGENPEAVMNEVFSREKPGVPAGSVALAVPAPELTPEQAFRAHIAWLKENRPAIYAEVARQRPDLVNPTTQLSGLGRVGGLDCNTGQWSWDAPQLDGLGFWDTLVNSTSALANIYAQVTKTSVDKKMLELQLEQAKNSRAPLPQPQAEQKAQQLVAVEQGGFKMPSWAPIAGAVLVLGGLGYFLFGRRRGGR